MPRRSRNRRRGKGGRGFPGSGGVTSSERGEASTMPSGIVRVPFRTWYEPQNAAGSAQVLSNSLTPGWIGGRVASLANIFLMYRVIKLRFTIVPNGNSTGLAAGVTVVAFGYSPVVFDSTAPTNLQTLLESVPSTMLHSVYQTAPTILQLKKRDLLASGQAVKWFKCNNPEISDLQQGQVLAFYDAIPSSSAQVGTSLLMDGVIEFTSPVVSGESFFRPLAPRPDEKSIFDLPVLKRAIELNRIDPVSVRPGTGIEEKSWADMDEADEPPDDPDRLERLERGFAAVIAKLDRLLDTTNAPVLSKINVGPNV